MKLQDLIDNKNLIVTEEGNYVVVKPADGYFIVVKDIPLDLEMTEVKMLKQEDYSDIITVSCMTNASTTLSDTSVLDSSVEDDSKI